MTRFAFAPLALLSLLLPALGFGADPVIEGLPVAGAVPNVEARIPAGKVLILPLTAYAEGGQQVTFTVTSSNPKVMARVRSGDPLMRFHIQHGDGTGTDTSDPDYEGDLVFQLFRENAPKAADYMAGFAQGGFWDDYTGHAGTIFHRLADLNDDKDPSTPALDSSFIFQGGDPQGTGFGGPGFSFRNEFSPSEIFTGRGQLAMANSGYNQTTLKGTNGSQFFITDAQPRHLDFNHTIFGQLTHGWDLLAKLKATARNASDAPLRPVRIMQSGVTAQYNDGTHIYTDAVLVLSATAIGTSEITVTAIDRDLHKTSKTFSAQAIKDDHNDPPFFKPLENRVGPLAKQVNIPFEVIDLERDYVSLGQGLLNNGSGVSQKGGSGFAGPTTYAVIGNPNYQTSPTDSPRPYAGVLNGAMAATQFDPARRAEDGQRAVDDYATVDVAIGEKAIKPLPVQIIGAPATALTAVVAGRFQDTDAQGDASNFAARINWGDGFAVSATGTVSRDGTTGGFATYQVTGSHTYKRAGIYPVVVTILSGLGLNQEIVSTAVITSDSITVSAGTRKLNEKQWLNREIARFTDVGTPGPATAYSVWLDWGDGVVSKGIVRALGGGVYSVLGTHTYRDSENFSYSVHVHKDDPATDAYGWGRMEVTGFEAAQHLPPFDSAHLVAQLVPVPVDPTNANSASKPVKQTEGDVTRQSQTFLNYQLIIINNGNKKSPAGRAVLLLSDDTTANFVPIKDQFGNVTHTADRFVEYGPPITAGGTERRSSLSLPPIEPGSSMAHPYTFQQSKLGDNRLRLPANETGTGYNMLVKLEWADGLANVLPIDMAAVTGPIQGIYVTPQVLQTSEAGGAKTFTVRIDKKPTADVHIPLSWDTTEASLDKTELVFTPADWSVPQTVTVTPKRDSALPSGTTDPKAADGNITFAIALQPAVSDDPLYNGLDGPDVTVTNVDIDKNITITGTSLTTTEAAGANHQATFKMKPLVTPAQSVSVELFIGNLNEGEIILPGETTPVITGEPIVVTWAAGDTTEKTITVQGKDDAVKDGDVTYVISFKATSDDPNFNGITPAIVTVKNIDND